MEFRHALIANITERCQFLGLFNWHQVTKISMSQVLIVNKTLRAGQAKTTALEHTISPS